jgi:response regulator RpfG family c-di-GMP phosphodiesterase
MAHAYSYNHNVMLVDDEPSVLKALRRVFRNEGFTIHMAENGPEALEKLKGLEDPVSLIISDQRMPGMNGAQFLEEAKALYPEAIRFLLTGYSDVDAIIAAVNEGEIHRYFTKPWDDKELIVKTRQSLKQIELKKENRRLQVLTTKQNDELNKLNHELEQKVAERTGELRHVNLDLTLANAKLEKSFHDAMRLMSSMIETLNPKLGKFMRNVASRARAVAEDLGVKKEKLETIEIAALIHDIGLMGMPETLLQKDEKEMTEREFDDFSNHPLIASVCLEPVENLKEVAEIILHHHEHYDGSGYPTEIEGEDIPVGSRIIGPISDFYRTANSWSDNLPQIKTKAAKLLGPAANELKMSDNQNLIAQIKRKFLVTRSPSLYDPRVVDCFISQLDAEDGSEKSKKEQTQRKVHFKNLRAGMVLADRLHTKDGRFVLAADTVLTDKLVNGIKRIGDGNAIEEELSVYSSN